MNELRPEIALLASAVTDGDRARALLAMPFSVMLTCEFTIRNRLMIAGYHDGLAYLETELTAMRTPRAECGMPPNSMAVAAARGRIYRVALDQPAASASEGAQ